MGINWYKQSSLRGVLSSPFSNINIYYALPIINYIKCLFGNSLFIWNWKLFAEKTVGKAKM